MPDGNRRARIARTPPPSPQGRAPSDFTIESHPAPRSNAAKLLLGLFAILAFCTCAFAGLLLLWRRLPRADVAAAGEAVCLACKSPAARLSPNSFICPACHRDVRDFGIGPRPTSPFQGPLWRVLTFSVILAVLALVASAIAFSALPRVHHVHTNQSLRMSGVDEQRVEMSVNGFRTPPDDADAPLEGDLIADLLLTTGDVSTLEVHSPALRYRVTDSAGHDRIPPSPPGAFNESAVLQWLAASGLDTKRHHVRSRARRIYEQIREMLSLPPTPLPPLPTPDEPPVSQSISGGSSYSGSTAPPQYVTPLALIISSILWLAGVCLILRHRRTPPTPRPTPSTQEAPA